MTIKEAILSFVPDGNIIEKVCVDRGLTSSDDYTVELKEDVDIATAYSMINYANKPDYSQGKLSVTIPRAQLLAEADRILKSYGIEVDAPGVSNNSNLW